MAKKSKEVKDTTYRGHDLNELVVVAPKINTKAKKGTWEYVKAAAKNRKQTTYTRDLKTGERTSHIVVTDSNGQSSYFIDPVDRQLIRRGQYTYRSNAKDNSFASGLQNFLNTTTAGAMDLASYVPYAAGHALNKLGSPVGKDLIQTSKDLELDARRINRYEVAPSDFWSASTLGSFLPSLGLAAVTGGKSLALDANTSRAFTKHITKDLGGSPFLSNILGSVAGAATMLPIGGATLQGATKQALTKYLQSAATRAALNTGIGVGTVAAPQLFTGDYEGAVNTATTIAPIIAGSSIVASGLPKAAAYKGYDALASKYLKNLHASDVVWAEDRQKLPWFISKRQADKARQLGKDVKDSFVTSVYENTPTSYNLYNAGKGHFDAPDLIPLGSLLENRETPTSTIIPEVFNLVEGQLADRVYRYIDPSRTSPENRLLQEAVQQSKRLTGNRMNVTNVPQATGEYRGTAVKDALLRQIIKGVFDADTPEMGTVGHYLKHTNSSEYDRLISEGALHGNRVEQQHLNHAIFTPMIKDGILYDFNPAGSRKSFRQLYNYYNKGFKEKALQDALEKERRLGVLFKDRPWDMRMPAERTLDPYTDRGVLDVIFRNGEVERRSINSILDEVQQSADEASLLYKIKKEYDENIPEGAERLQIHKVEGANSPEQAKALFGNLLPEILRMLNLDLPGVAAKDIPLHTRALHGWESVKDMLETGVISSNFGKNWKGVTGGQESTAFVQGRKKLDPVPLFGTDLENATPISQRTSPDHDLRAGSTSHYVKFNGNYNNGLGGNLVAVVDPTAMIEALGGAYYLLGKPHGIEFSYASKYSPSKSLVRRGKQGLYIDSRNTFERIADIDDYVSLSERLPHIKGDWANHHNVLTTHRTIGRELRPDESKVLQELGAREDALRRGHKGKAPIVPIAPPIEAYSLIEYVRPPLSISPEEIGNYYRGIARLSHDLDYVNSMIGPGSDKVQLSIDREAAKAEAAKNTRLMDKLNKFENPEPNAPSGLYILPSKEMKKVKDARSAKDSDYAYMYTETKDGKKVRHSRQL